MADARVNRPVRVRRLLDRVHRLDVVRHDDAGHRALGERDPQRAIDHVSQLLGRRDHLAVLARDVLEEREEIDLLLVAAAERGQRLLADDRDDGLVVELRVVEAVQEMDRARAGGRQADADLAGELRVRTRHEGGHLLVAHLDELHPLLGARERAHDPVDAVARVAVDAPDAPVGEPLDEEVAHVHAACSRASRAVRVAIAESSGSD